MRKKTIFWLLMSALVMLLLPWMAVTFVRSDAGMMAVLILLFAVNPGYCMAAGYSAGKQIRRFWWIPAYSAAMFLLGVWLFFEAGESDFWIYTAVYYALGMEAMFVSRLITGRREKDE